MTDFPYKIIGFDLDGTLLDTSPELTAATNHALNLAGCPALTAAEVRPMVGLGAKHMLTVGLAKAAGLDEGEAKTKTREYLPALLDFYGENLGTGSPPWPGLLDVMEQFDAMGVKMAVVTNKFERFAHTLLKEIDLFDRFTCVIGSDSLGKDDNGKWLAKPDRAPIDEMIRRSDGTLGETKAAFIGDSIYDVMAAQGAGIPAIAVSFGFLHQPVDTLGADAIIDHYDALIGTLETLA